MGNSKYKRLLEPGYIGTVKTKNRMVKMGAHPGFYKYEDGYIAEREADYYETIAKGGIGLLTVAAPPLGDPPGKGYRLDNKKYIPRMAELVNKIQKNGIPAFMQQFHIGPWIPGIAIAPSALSREEIPIKSYPEAKELTKKGIKDVVKQFGDQAELIKKCGFTGIELNAGCSHLLDQFLSRPWNKRKDEYGGSLENRARIVVKIIREIKKRNGKDFAVISLYNIVEPGFKDGINLEEGKEFAKIFEAAGADAINIRNEFYMTRKATGNYDSTHFPDVAFFPEPPAYATKDIVDTAHHGIGGWVPCAVAIKKVVKIPVIISGRMDADLGEKLLRRGVVDFVNFNRRVMADPEYPNKIAEGRPEDIAPCTACQTCWQAQIEDRVPECRINAALGNEKAFEIKPALKKKKVVVIGGGPAGMEAARVAALRGHNVTLLEKLSYLGGSMNMAAVVKGTDREDLVAIIEYYKTQLGKLGVVVQTGIEATKAVVDKLKPDTIIVAVGAKHNIPEIPGIRRKNVLTSEALHGMLKKYLKLTGAKLMTKLVKLTNYLPVGRKVVLVGGALQGCQTAEFLMHHGREVVIVEETDQLGDGIPADQLKPQLLDWMDKKGGVTKITGATFNEVTNKGLVITTKDGKKQTLEGKTVITALPLKPNKDLYEKLQDVAHEIYAIGDCNNPKLIVDAVADGARIGRKI